MEEIDDEKSSPETLRRFIDQYKEHIDDTKYYIEERDWGILTDSGSFADRQKEHNIEWNLVKNLSDRLAYFIKEAEGHIYKPYIQNFIRDMKEVLESYIQRCNKFRKLNKWSDIVDPDYMDVQITFQDELLKNITILRKVMGKINIDDAKGETKKIPIHGDKKVPFLMRSVIEKEFPSEFK